MTPTIDYHAFAPELVLTGTIVLVLLVDLVLEGRDRTLVSRIAALGTLGALVPVLTLGADGADRTMFGGAYEVNNFSLVLKAFFLIAAYVTILISVDYIREGDYHQGEYYFLILVAVLGMMIMTSARDLITIFVALETISIPTYMLAGWRKHDARSNEAAVKYYIFGVLSSAVMLYGMSLLFGVAQSTLITEVASAVAEFDDRAIVIVGIAFTIVGFAFKVSAVPFHFWAPDTYEGAPTPVTAFLSVASKAGGFVALMIVVYYGFFAASDTWQPLMWVLAALSMTVANVIAIQQTNVVRMLAYSSVSQAGFMLVPFAVAAESAAAAESAFQATVVYMLIYGAMNLGAFGVVMAVARRTRSGEISTFAGLFSYAPGLAVLMSVFLFSLAGVPPLAGWFAKFVVFRAVLDAGTTWAVILGVVAAVNSVIAFFYYAGVARQMWFQAPAVEDTSPIRIPGALAAGVALTTAVVLVIGVYPEFFARLGELTTR
ncbi:MAG TPA: NADH-quinone oxidoreductase subunit N [Acidimicrobiia bacterium]|nr:NADH-quinone oxidoreductase subunit N [Acidimicrobiia bacterium]